jgi:hypothetical protein
MRHTVLMPMEGTTRGTTTLTRSTTTIRTTPRNLPFALSSRVICISGVKRSDSCQYMRVHTSIITRKQSMSWFS